MISKYYSQGIFFAVLKVISWYKGINDDIKCHRVGTKIVKHVAKGHRCPRAFRNRLHIMTWRVGNRIELRIILQFTFLPYANNEQPNHEHEKQANKLRKKNLSSD